VGDELLALLPQILLHKLVQVVQVLLDLLSLVDFNRMLQRFFDELFPLLPFDSFLQLH